jgi:hypothetical protein
MAYSIGDHVTIIAASKMVPRLVIGKPAVVVAIGQKSRLTIRTPHGREFNVSREQIRAGWPDGYKEQTRNAGGFCAHCIDAEHGLEQRLWRGKKVWLCFDCRNGRMVRDIAMDAARGEEPKSSYYIV